MIIGAATGFLPVEERLPQDEPKEIKE